MQNTFLTTLTATFSLLALNANADWNPQVYNAIKWTAPNQGRTTIAYTTSVGITRVPMAYHGGVDANASGEITEQNISHFKQWVLERLPSGYCGPVVMDYEQPWWHTLGAKTITQDSLQEIISVYGESMQIAKNTLPDAQWGFWGLPLLRNTGEKWKAQGVSLDPLLKQCNGLYPDIYDSSRGEDTSARAQRHIESVLKSAAGQIPVYAFVSPRFTGEGKDHSYFIPDDVFLRHVNGAMKAAWTDATGQVHKIQGIILWDAYGYTPEAGWDDLDTKHAYYFQLMQALVEAWEKSMVGVSVETNVVHLPNCKYALPEPKNSETAIDDAPLQRPSQNNFQNRERSNLESERIPSGRIPSGRE